MPCNSDYMAPTKYEGEIMRTAALLVYIKGHLDLPISKDEERFGVGRDYCRITRAIGDAMVAELCGLMSSLHYTMVEELCYNIRSKQARDLADWWEDHRAADLARLEKEQEAAEVRARFAERLPPADLEPFLRWYTGLGNTAQDYVNKLVQHA